MLAAFSITIPTSHSHAQAGGTRSVTRSRGHREAGCLRRSFNGLLWAAGRCQGIAGQCSFLSILLEKRGRNLETCLGRVGRWEGKGPAGSEQGCKSQPHVVWFLVGRVVSPFGGSCWTNRPQESRQVPGSHPCPSCPKPCRWAAGTWCCPPPLWHWDSASPGSEGLKFTLPRRFLPLLKAFTAPKIPLEPCSGFRGRSSGPSSYDTFTALCSVASRHIVN